MLRYKEIKNDLIKMVETMNHGDALPSRTELCKELDTTNNTLAKAIKELCDEGVLSTKNGSGTFKMSLTGDTKIQIVDKYENWGIIVVDVMEKLYNSLVRGVENETREYGVNLIVCNSDSNAQKQNEYIKRLVGTGVSGLIIVPVINVDLEDNLHLYKFLQESDVPFVFCNRCVSGIDAPLIKSNDFYGGYIQTKFLLSKGYKNIAYVSKHKYATSEERCQGYMSALIEDRQEIKRNRIIINSRDIGKEEDVIAEMLINDSEIDAISCFNDSVAIKAYSAARMIGKEIGRDIGIIGYDDTEICKMIKPKLSSVSYRSVDMGHTAAKVLWKITKNMKLNDFNIYLHQPEIVDRESCLKNI